MIKVAINGFGRIGRQALRIILDKYPDMQVVAINDLTDNKTLAHLLRYDSTYGEYEHEIFLTDDGKMCIDACLGGRSMKILSERDPSKLPWKEMEIDVVLESTGVFRTREKAAMHLQAGAKKVIISAPGKDKIDGTFVLGVNEDSYDPQTQHIISNASCTTNCLAPVAKVLNDNFGIVKGTMTTIHSFTNDQRILDLPHSDLRRARSAPGSIIPTTTGAAKAVGLVLPELQGKLDGLAVRVPTPTVSLIDFVCEVEKSTTKEEVIKTFEDAAEKLPGILGVEHRPLVSVDFKKNSHSAVVDALSTDVTGGNMVKILAWYDNEWGYANRYVDLAHLVGKSL